MATQRIPAKRGMTTRFMGDSEASNPETDFLSVMEELRLLREEREQQRLREQEEREQ